jgi:hypothetical protein
VNEEAKLGKYREQLAELTVSLSSRYYLQAHHDFFAIASFSSVIE